MQPTESGERCLTWKGHAGSSFAWTQLRDSCEPLGSGLGTGQGTFTGVTTNYWVFSR